MKAQIVSFNCVLKNKLGHVLSSSFNHDVINQLEDGNSCPGKLRGFIAKIQNVHEGERRLFTVPTAEAYGPYDPDLLVNVARSDLSTDNSFDLGSEIISRSPQNGCQLAYRVVRIDGDRVMLDGNHPLAGQDLIFDIEVVSARDACSTDFEKSPSASTGRYVH
jgi:FKBP-type peptidyl-prolyl cis-trans isomerase SlyD